MKTKLSLQINENIMSWETTSDAISADEMCEVFYQIMIGSTYIPDNVINGMKKVINDYGNES
jgi:hypothetical protein